MRAGRGALLHDSPTSPKTPRREGEAWGGGLCGRSGSPAPCLPCGGGNGSLPPACAAPQCARCRRVRRGRALWGYALAWGWLEAETEWAGVGLGWSAHAPPALCFPLPAPTAPQAEEGARNAPRPALMLRFHPRFLPILIAVPANMNDILRWVEYKLVEVVIHLNRAVYHVHLLGRVSLNVEICRLT